MSIGTQLSEEEIVRRLPEVNTIDDSVIREQTILALREITPEYFWTAPAASSYNHHNPFCCNKHGLWVHTKMVTTAYSRLAPTYLQQNRISETEADLGKAACLLHDTRKYGESYSKGQRADKDHDIQAANWLADNSRLDERAIEAVASHMGGWYMGPSPETDLDDLVHSADMFASSKNLLSGLYKPAEEIVEFYPLLPNAVLDD